MRDFTIHSNTNGLGLRSNTIKDLCPLILHQLVVGWIGKAHGPIVWIENSRSTPKLLGPSIGIVSAQFNPYS